MVLSKREQFIVWGAGIVLGLLVLDHFVVGPLLSARDAMAAEKQRLLAGLSRTQNLLRHRKQIAPLWKEMTATGLKATPAEAESQVMHAMRDWAESSRVDLSLLKPDRPTDTTKLPQIVFQAAGTGSMDAVARLLWRIQNATIPLRVSELQISPRKEGTDDLSVQMRLSTLYLPAASSGTAAPASGGAK